MATFDQLEQEVASIGNNLRNLDMRDVNDKDGFHLVANLPGTSAATAANYTHFFTVRHPMEVISVSEVHGTAATTGTVTLDVEKLTGTTVPGSGTSILATTFDLKGAINTPVFKQGIALAANRQFVQGDRIALADTGTLTALDSVQVTLYCKYLGRGTYR